MLREETCYYRYLKFMVFKGDTTYFGSKPGEAGTEHLARTHKIYF